MTRLSPRSVLLTPNLLGADGVSCLSRQIVRALPGPIVTVSLHDVAGRDDNLHAAAGHRGRFVADALRVGLHCDRDTIIVCSHVHLAPVARRNGRCQGVTSVNLAWRADVKQSRPSAGHLVVNDFCVEFIDRAGRAGCDVSLWRAGTPPFGDSA